MMQRSEHPKGWLAGAVIPRGNVHLPQNTA